MPEINAFNANDKRKEALAELTAMVESARNEATGTGEVPAPPADPAPSGVDAGGAGENQVAVGESGNAGAPNEPNAEASGKPKEEKPKGEKTLEEKYAILDRNFRALQASITPTQQERAALEREVKALKARIAEMGGSPDGEDRVAALKAAADKASEVVPEVAEAMRLLAAETEDRRANEQLARQEAEASAARATMGQIMKAHPDAAQVAHPQNDDFWNYVDSFGDISAQYREILSKPYAYAGGAELVSDIFQSYKEERGLVRRDVPKPSDLKRPTSVTPPVKDVQPVPSGHGNGPKTWTPRELAEQTKNLNSLHGQKALDMAGRLREQLAALAGQGR